MENDVDIEKQAMQELLSESKRAKARADLAGAYGWKKCPLPSANKRFINNTVLSTLRSRRDHSSQGTKEDSPTPGKDLSKHARPFHRSKHPAQRFEHGRRIVDMREEDKLEPSSRQRAGESVYSMSRNSKHDLYRFDQGARDRHSFDDRSSRTRRSGSGGSDLSSDEDRFASRSHPHHRHKPVKRKHSHGERHSKRKHSGEDRSEKDHTKHRKHKKRKEHKHKESKQI